MTAQGADVPPGYQSALDLPSFVELLQQLRGATLLTRVIGRAQRQQFLEVERQVRAMAATIDRFYDLLGERHWVFHDDLHMDRMAALVKAEASVEELEQRFIAEQYGDSEWLPFMVGRLHGLPAMRRRMPLLLKALDDYQAGRYYATTLVLITAMDGFVNDLDPANRRGLHARDASELAAWDSVVGHHKGLAAAHATFTRGFKGTSDEPVYELYRNGVVHGNLTNFDNVIVATKAWNRLFAVADWARAREKEQQPKEPQPSWGQLFQQLAENGRVKKLLTAWQPYTLTPDQAEITEHAVYEAAEAFFAAWHGQKYGVMVSALPWQSQQLYGKRAAGELRALYQRHRLSSARIDKLDFVAPSICMIGAVLQVNGVDVAVTMRWIHERPDSDDTVVEPDVGAWRLILWGPDTFLPARLAEA
jgi:hypothetical protein